VNPSQRFKKKKPKETFLLFLLLSQITKNG
jgi:hypothetical protein